MLAEQQPTTGLEHASRLSQGRRGTVDGTQSKGADYGVEAGRVKRQSLGRARVYAHVQALRPRRGHSQGAELCGRINADHLADQVGIIETEVEAHADAKL